MVAKKLQFFGNLLLYLQFAWVEITSVQLRKYSSSDANFSKLVLLKVLNYDYAIAWV